MLVWINVSHFVTHCFLDKIMIPAKLLLLAWKHPIHQCSGRHTPYLKIMQPRTLLDVTVLCNFPNVPNMTDDTRTNYL